MLIRDIAQFTSKELGIYKASPATAKEWEIINSLLSEKVNS